MVINDDIDIDNWDEIKDILPQITVIKSLYLINMGLTQFPKMSHITIKDNFYCINNKIASFTDSPIINGNFVCCNNHITSFKDCPIIRGNLFSDFDIFDKIQRYSKRNKISLLKAQVELYNNHDDEILEHINKFPDLIAYIRMKELNKLL